MGASLLALAKSICYSYNLVLKDFEVKQVSRETKKGLRY